MTPLLKKAFAEVTKLPDSEQDRMAAFYPVRFLEAISATANVAEFSVTLEQDKYGVRVVECRAIPGCVSQGETKEEAVSNIKEATAAGLKSAPSNL